MVVKNIDPKRGDGMNRSASTIIGWIIVAIGVIGLLANMGIVNIGWENFWTLLIIGIGVAFEASYFTGGRANPGILVPAGIFMVTGAVLLVGAFIGWDWMEFLWPLFVLAPAVGLFQLYIFGGREKALMIPITILSTVGIVFLLINLQEFKTASLAGSGLLILAGAALITGSGRRRS